MPIKQIDLELHLEKALEPLARHLFAGFFVEDFGGLIGHIIFDIIITAILSLFELINFLLQYTAYNFIVIVAHMIKYGIFFALFFCQLFGTFQKTLDTLLDR